MTFLSVITRPTAADQAGIRIAKGGTYHHVASYGYASEFREYLSQHPLEPDRASIGKSERDVTALETRKTQARERIVLLGKAIKQLEDQRQLDAQAYMMEQSAAIMSPLVAPLDQATAKLALPPHMPDKPVKLEPDVIKPKQTFKWFGNPKQGDGQRWNQR